MAKPKTAKPRSVKSTTSSRPRTELHLEHSWVTPAMEDVKTIIDVVAVS
jgi:hypothetical protein